jgi:hypothetical protein
MKLIKREKGTVKGPNKKTKSTKQTRNEGVLLEKNNLIGTNKSMNG